MKINGVLISIPVLLLACGEDKTPEPVVQPEKPVDTLFWDMPHSRFLGLRGTVTSCIQIGLDDEMGEVERLTMEFDTCGRLLWYDPLGLAPEQPATYNTGWIDPTTYRYEYNDKGQLITATLDVMGVGTTVYRLKYGDHGSYVPLPFVLGNQSFFLVYNLTEVKSETMTYTCDGKKASFTTDSWQGTTSVVYDFKDHYPVKCTETTFRGEDTSQVCITTYTFGDKKSLDAYSARTIYPGSEESTQSDVTYVQGFLLLPATEVLQINDVISSRLKYEYDASGNLTSKSYERGIETGESESGTEETNSYFGWDKNGNWTLRDRIIPGMGVMKYRRELKYRK